MPVELERNLSKEYRWTGAGHELQAFEFLPHIGPAGVISSTTGDMARYMVMLLNDEVWPHAGNTAEGGTSRFTPPTGAFPAAVGNWYGGFLRGRVPGGFTSIGHDGGSLLFFSSMLLMPELRLGVFIMMALSGLPGRFLPADEPDVLENADRQTMQAARVRYEGNRVARIETPLMGCPHHRSSKRQC